MNAINKPTALETSDAARAAGEPPAGTAAPVDAQSALPGRLLVALAAVMWSTSGLFAKATMFEVWAPEDRGILLAFWRAAFAGVLLLPAVRRPRWDVKLIPLCLAFTLMNVTYLSAMSLTTAANSIWLQSTAPWWVLLVGVLVLGEPFPRSERLPLVIGGLGLAIILGFEVQGQARAGVLCGLVSGFAYASVVLCLRALRALDTVWIVAVAHLVTAVLIFPYVAYLNVWPTPMQLPVLAGFGLIQMALPYVCFARGLRSITSQEATVIGLLEPILLPVWVYLAWNEVPAPWTIVGGGLILTGLVLRYGIPLLRRRGV
ncbi:MAG: DMT family transporter [Planctomycetota bacterium]|nr:MAG: DMT family transporter [Planctomycetota bacterium]